MKKNKQRKNQTYTAKSLKSIQNKNAKKANLKISKKNTKKQNHKKNIKQVSRTVKKVQNVNPKKSKNTIISKQIEKLNQNKKIKNIKNIIHKKVEKIKNSKTIKKFKENVIIKKLVNIIHFIIEKIKRFIDTLKRFFHRISIKIKESKIYHGLYEIRKKISRLQILKKIKKIFNWIIVKIKRIISFIKKLIGKIKVVIQNSKIIKRITTFFFQTITYFSVSLVYLLRKMKQTLWVIIKTLSATYFYIFTKVFNKNFPKKISKKVKKNSHKFFSITKKHIKKIRKKNNKEKKDKPLKKNKQKNSSSKMMSRSMIKTTNKVDTSKKINHKEKIRKPLFKTIQIRYYFLTGFIVLSMLFLVINLFKIQILDHNYYKGKVVSLTEKIVYGDSAPRGRIYDRNHKLLVNNKPLKIIYYKKPNKVTTKKEMDLAYKLQGMLSLDYSKVTGKALKRFWILKNRKLANKKITEEEWTQLDERKITQTDIYNKKMERITEDDLKSFKDEDTHAAYLYDLMNKGYSYDEKVIKKDDVTDEEYALISENVDELPGIGTKLDWERQYLYGDTFKTIFGSVSSSESGIPSELKEDYLKKGYSLKDRVGTSYLEYQYEDILKGTKNKYKVLGDGTYQLLKEGKRGNDLVLTIDIDLQREIEQILAEELIATKSEPNTEFYNRSFVIIEDAKTGEILAMAGKQIQNVNGEYKIYDYTPGILTSPVVIGSAVKGASHIVGYNTGALYIGENRYDSCVKIAATPLKCSWTNLGLLNDITAIAQSSNTYQFYTAMRVGRGNYIYDGALKIDPSAFDTYRNTFAEFGLGVKTEIDLPKESLGYKGSDRKPGLLLDFSIGQYDNYTPIQLSQYITTIANNGNRLRPHLLKEVYNPTKDGLTSLKSVTETKVLNKVNTEDRYMQRVKEGFRSVMTYGTGTSYMDYNYNAAGKTGTAESFYDSDKDGKIDTPTVSNSFVAYAPYYDPKVTFTIISPDISHRLYGSTYNSTVNKRITQRVTQKYFDFYG